MSDVERATAITTFSEAPPPADEISDLDTRGFVQVVRIFVRTWPFLRPMVNGYWRQRTFARIGVGQRNTAWSFVHAPPLATIVTLMGPVTGLLPWGVDLKLDLLLIATVAMAVLTWLILLSRNRVQAIAGVLLVLIGITANAAAVMAVTGYGDNLQVGLVTLACLSLWFVQYRRAEGRLQIRVRLGTHLVYYFGVVWLFVFIGLITALFSADILNQSLLIGKPLTPFVADLINRPDLGEGEVRVPVKSDADPTTPQSTDGETTLSQEQRYELRWYYLIFAIGLFVIGLHTMVLNYYNVWIMQAINQGLRNALLERWHRLSLTYHGDHRVGDSVYRIFQDSAQVTNVIAVVMRMAQTLIMYLMTLLFVTALDPVLGTLILVVSGFALLWGRWFSPRIRRRSLSARESNAALTSRIQEIFSNIRLIKAHGGEDLEQRRFETDSVTAFNAAFRLRFFTALVTILMFTVAALVFMGGPSKAPIIHGSSTGLRSLSMVARRRR